MECEIGRLAELARRHNSYLTPPTSPHASPRRKESEPGASAVSVTANARISDRVVLSLFSLVVVGSEVGRLAELSSWA